MPTLVLVPRTFCAVQKFLLTYIILTREANFFPNILNEFESRDFAPVSASTKRKKGKTKSKDFFFTLAEFVFKYFSTTVGEFKRL